MSCLSSLPSELPHGKFLLTASFLVCAILSCFFMYLIHVWLKTAF